MIMKKKGFWSRFWRRHQSSQKNAAVTINRDNDGLVLRHWRSRIYYNRIPAYVVRSVLLYLWIYWILFFRSRVLVSAQNIIALVDPVLFITVMSIGGALLLLRLLSVTVTIRDSEITVRNKLYSNTYKVEHMTAICMTKSSLYTVFHGQSSTGSHPSEVRLVLLVGLQLREAQSIMEHIQCHPSLAQIQSKVFDFTGSKEKDTGWLHGRRVLFPKSLVFAMIALCSTVDIWENAISINKLSAFPAYPNLIEFKPYRAGYYRDFGARYREAAILTYFPSSGSSSSNSSGSSTGSTIRTDDLARIWNQISLTCQHATVAQDTTIPDSLVDCRKFGFAIVNCTRYPYWSYCRGCDSHPCMLRGQSLMPLSSKFLFTVIEGSKNISNYMQDRNDSIVDRPLAMPSLYQALNIESFLQDLGTAYFSSALLLYHPQNPDSKTLAVKWNALAARCHREPKSCTTSSFAFSFVDCSTRMAESSDLCHKTDLAPTLLHGRPIRTMTGEKKVNLFMDSFQVHQNGDHNKRIVPGSK